ncbi:MAG TPA: ABC transporter permease [Solirubrobacterales bacterium]|nr:ABC transporter permease [Solirubrobacterales bacterium]
MTRIALHARLALAGLARSPARTALRIAVVTAAVALLAGMLLFIGHSLRTASASAVRQVPLDWQGPVSSYKQARAVATGVSRQAGIAEAAATATAPFAASTHAGPAGRTSTSQGSVLAVPPGYGRGIHTFRLLHGSLKPGDVVLDQQMAATLQARVGDRVTLEPRPGSPPKRYTVSGVGLITVPDQVFQPLNPLLGPAPAQPPENAVLMPISTFARTLAPELAPITAANAASNAQPGAQKGVQWEVQAQLDAGPLVAGSPSAALKLADQTRNRVESSLPGRVQFVDNLSDSLTTASEDSLYAQALYIMLAVPGALVALGVAYLAALGTSERDRRDLALLRARGARRRDLVALAAAESVGLGVAAGLLGAALGFVAVQLLVNGGAHLTTGRALVTVAVSVLLGVLGSGAARIAATESVLRRTVAEGRRSAVRDRPAAWRRYYLDLLALALSGLIYWLTIRTGFSAVVNPDANPTLSLSIYMFFGPALLWIGATLLLVRVRGRAVAWLAGRAAARNPGSLGSFLLASAGRRGPAINRGLLVVGLLLAFGVSLAIFAATYDQQARADAQLTLGADVTVAAPPGAIAKHDLAGKVAAVRGVAATTPLDHSYAYVGPDLQDTYGIDPATFPHATSLRDSYFLGGTASQMMSRLQQTRDGIMVSLETINDYSLKPGDLLRLRVLDQRTGHFRVVPFHVVGTVQEFPSAPRDSFMVTNLSYLESATHAPGPNEVFARSTGDPGAVATGVAAATRGFGTRVENLDDQTAKTVTSITTVDLSGISHIEEAFAVALAAAAIAMFVLTAVAERKHELATMAAVGAPLREVAAFVWSEAGLVLGAGVLLAAGLGWLLATMLVAMLTHVFDPPPDHLAIPWRYLAALGGASLAAMLGSCALAARRLRALPLGAILRER